MASTAGGLARLELRCLTPKSSVASTPSCSYSTAASRRAATGRMSLPSGRSELPRKVCRSSAPTFHLWQRNFCASAVSHSAWPAGAVGAGENDDPSFPPSSKLGKGKAKAITAIPSPPRSKTIADLHALKHHPDGSVPIVCLTAYDLPTALSIRSADIDLCLIGDSLANVALGFTSTQPLSLDAMIHHCQAVKRGLDAPLFSTASLLEGIDLPQPPLVIADMPFGATFGSIDSGVAAVVRLMQDTGIDGIKIEGSYEAIPLIRRLTEHGIPVMGHLGLQPQRVGSTSGYRLQGRTAQQAKEILDASLALEKAGCFSIVLECIPTRVGELISQRLSIPTIGIGAGSKTDGQILVMNDMIGDLTGAGHVLAALAQAQTQASPAREDGIEASAIPQHSPLTPPSPKFVRNFSLQHGTSIGAMRMAAVQAYTQAVRQRRFPDDGVEAYKMKSEEWKAFQELAAASTNSKA